MTVPTHLALSIDSYKKLGQFLASLPYSQVAPVIAFIEGQAKGYVECETEIGGVILTPVDAPTADGGDPVSK